MKAVCILLSLALPTAIVGRIFNQYAQPQYPQFGEILMNPLDFIDQYQYKATDDRASANNENFREAKGDVASYIQKYIEVLNFDKDVNNKNQRKAQKNSQAWTNQLNARARLNKLRENDENNQQSSLYQQYAPQYTDEQQREIYNEMPGRVFNMQLNRDGDAVEIVKEARFGADKYNMNQKPIYKAQYSPDQSGLLNHPSQEIKDLPIYGDAVSWRGISMAVGPYSPVATKEDIEKIYADAYNTMNNYTEEAKLQFHRDYEMAASLENEDIHFNATEMMRKHQYYVEEHTVKTDDGYILTLFRIAPSAMTTQKRPVVLFVHGLLGSADDWLLMGPGKSLPYILAEAGYDVWLGNTRGSKYSRHHVSKHPALPDFWQYSNDEIALHDVPAMLDYTLQTTKEQKLVYVGYSQGATAFFALASSRPAYNDKITMMYALSPMVYMTHVRSPLIKMIAPNSAFYESIYEQLGRGEFQPSKALLRDLGGSFCEKEIGCKFVCSNLNFIMSGVNVQQLNTSLLPVILSHMPSGASARQLKQYGQALASNEFRMYDYGTELNTKVYGAPQPPKYQLSAVSAPVSLYYSDEDWMAAPVDVERLRRELPNVSEYYKVPEQYFGSLDFLVGNSAPATVYKRIADSVQKNAVTY